MVAKTFQGLEEVLRDELIALGAENVETGRRMVSFDGNLALLYKANLCCRSALRILKPIIKFTASNPDELYDCVRDIEWEKYLSVDSTFSIDSTVNSADFTHSKYVTYRVKDGIADHFTDNCGRRPSIRLKGADLMLNVHIQDDRVTISLDSSGEPLSKRGYRVEQTEAPVNEALAAGLILKTGWHGECDFADPMCGSGTFLIEAALIAANINPGIFRESFAFEKWPDFDAGLFESIYNDDSEEREFNYRITGGDIDPEAVAIARRNIRSARVDNMVTVECKSMGDWHELDPDGVLVMNPPYGERLKPDDMEQLYRNIGKWLKTEFGGWHAWILGYKDEHFDAIHLKPSVKFPVLNGALECSFREYVLFAGSYDDFRAEGGSVGNDSFEQPSRKAPRRLSDREWREESSRFDGRDARRKERRDRRDDRRDDRGRREERGRDRKPRNGRDRRRDDRRDDRDFRRDGHKDFRKGAGKGSKTREVADRAPQLPEESAVKFANLRTRPRKGWKKSNDNEA